ncbi:MAG: metal-dependent transcriptional regulator [Luteibaculaceae bacterium]
MQYTSESEENYLKAIYHLWTKGGKAISTNQIAERLEMKAPSVTDMLKKLAEKNLIHYIRYQGVTLTKEGELKALKIIRKHRLWEYFLVEKLKFSWSEVHDIAEQLEHVESTELIDKLDDFLGHPQFDPHGDPIPDREGKMLDKQSVLLSQLKINQAAKITGVRDSSSDFLEYLDLHQLTIGEKISIDKIFTFDDSMQLYHHRMEKFVPISGKVANNIFVLQVRND